MLYETKHRMGYLLRIALATLVISAQQSNSFRPTIFVKRSSYLRRRERSAFIAKNAINERQKPTKNGERRRCELFLVPLSEAWDSDCDDNGIEPFSLLVEKLGCPKLDAQGRILDSSVSTSFSRPSGDVTEIMDVKNSIDDEYGCFRLYLAQTIDDLPAIARLTVDVFDATAINLSSSSDWSAWERALIEPPVGMYNAYANVVAYTEVLTGLKKRMVNRMTMAGSENRAEEHGGWLTPLVEIRNAEKNLIAEEHSESRLEQIAAKSSLILAVARVAEPSSSDSTTSDQEMEVVATIELRLQPTDAKIPFSQPWLDSFERRLARFMDGSRGNSGADILNGKDSNFPPQQVNPPLRPYLCNLCVSPPFRTMGIGRALVRVVENIARQHWGYDHMYLHVDPENDAARKLYEKEGYEDVGRRWNVFWAGGAEKIGYYVKALG